MKEFIPRLLFFFVFVFSFFVLFEKIKPSKDALLNWDETDYANAARKGILANAVEAGSLSITQFVRLSLLKKNKQEDKISELKLPEESGDIFLLRHFHPPFPTYYWSFFSHYDGERMTERMRLGNIIWAFISVAVMIICLYLITQNASQTILGGLMLSVFYLSDAFTSGFYSINFHIFHLPACIFFCSMLVLYIEEPKQMNSFLVSIALIILVGTLEMGVFVALAALFWGLVSGYRKVLFSGRKVAEMLVMCSGFLILFWIGIFRTLSPAKAYLTYFYRIFAKSNEEYERVSYLDNWINYFSENSALFVLIAGGVAYGVYLLVKRRITGAEMLPMLIGLSYCVVMTPFMLAPVYVLPAIGMVVFGIVFMVMRSHINFLSEIGVSSLSVIACAFVFFNLPAESPQKRIFEQTEELRKNLYPLLRNQENIYANGAHILNFYLPLEKPIKPLERFSIADPDFYIRKNYRYEDFKPEILKGKADAVILLRWMNYPESKLKFLEEAGFRRHDFKEWQIFVK